MEPVSILGFVSAVVTFLDLASEILKISREIKHSVEGHTATNAEVSQSLVRLDGLCDAILSRQATVKGSLSRSENAIKQLAGRCVDAGDRLRSLLSGIAVQDGSTLANLRASAKALMKDSKIRRIQQEIQSIYQELNLHLALAISKESSNTSKLFNDIMETQVQLQLANTDELRQCREDLQKVVAGAKQKETSNFEEIGVLLNEINKVDAKLQEAREVQKILQSLSFPGMDDRRRQIHDAHRSTFDWIFEGESDQKLYFNHWLKSPLSNVYWIKGKPGSGKSTLMKYLCQHELILRFLRTWSGDKELVTASFFFWRASPSALEKSSEGLLRSLLFEILKQCPHLICPVIKSNAEYQTSQAFSSQQWTVSGLTKIFEDISKVRMMTTAFCFFIDGLDEYQGESRELANAILTLGSPENIKICVASRAWAAFEAAFGVEPKLVLDLHRHTYSDIKLYATEVLGSDNLFLSLSSSDSAYLSVIQTIVDKAEGVFLWVALVVRELTNTLPNADSAKAMLERLKGIPSDLDEYFWYMLKNIPQFYRKDSCQILLMLLEAELRPSAYAVYLSLDSTPSGEKLTRSPEHKLEKEAALIRKRLQIRTQDLLEINVGHELDIWLCDCRIRFIHRTVHDFLLKEDVLTELKSVVSTSFSTKATLCAAYLDSLRSFPYIPTITRTQNEENARSLVNHFALYAQGLEQDGKPCDTQLYHLAQSCMMEIARTLLPGFTWSYPAGSSSMMLWLKQLSQESNAKKRPELLQDVLLDDIEHFLPYALRYGLTSYVSSIMRKPPWYEKPRLTKYLIQEIGLYFALAVRKGFETHRNSGAVFIYPTHRRVYEPMIRLLLELGANPNYKLDGYSAWELFLEDVVNDRLFPRDLTLPARNCQDLTLATRNCKVMRTMIEHGADYTLVYRLEGENGRLSPNPCEQRNKVNALELGKTIAIYSNLKSEEEFFNELERKATLANLFDRLKTIFWSGSLKSKAISKTSPS